MNSNNHLYTMKSTRTLLALSMYFLLAESTKPRPSLTKEPANVLQLVCRVPFGTFTRNGWKSVESIEIQFRPPSSLFRTVVVSAARNSQPQRGQLLPQEAKVQNFTGKDHPDDHRVPFLSVVMPIDENLHGQYFCEIEGYDDSNDKLTLSFAINVTSAFVERSGEAGDYSFSAKSTKADHITVTWKTDPKSASIEICRSSLGVDGAGNVKSYAKVLSKTLGNNPPQLLEPGILLASVNVSDHAAYKVSLFSSSSFCHPNCSYQCGCESGDLCEGQDANPVQKISDDYGNCTSMVSMVNQSFNELIGATNETWKASTLRDKLAAEKNCTDTCDAEKNADKLAAEKNCTDTCDAEKNAEGERCIHIRNIILGITIPAIILLLLILIAVFVCIVCHKIRKEPCREKKTLFCCPCSNDPERVPLTESNIDTTTTSAATTTSTTRNSTAATSAAATTTTTAAATTTNSTSATSAAFTTTTATSVAASTTTTTTTAAAAAATTTSTTAASTAAAMTTSTAPTASGATATTTVNPTTTATIPVDACGSGKQDNSRQTQTGAVREDDSGIYHRSTCPEGGTQEMNEDRHIH